MYSQTIVLPLRGRAAHWLEQFPFLTTSSLPSLPLTVTPRKDLTLTKKNVPLSFLPFPRRLSSRRRLTAELHGRRHRHNQPAVQHHASAGAKASSPIHSPSLNLLRLLAAAGSIPHAAPRQQHGGTGLAASAAELPSPSTPPPLYPEQRAPGMLFWQLEFLIN